MTKAAPLPGSRSQKCWPRYQRGYFKTPGRLPRCAKTAQHPTPKSSTSTARRCQPAPIPATSIGSRTPATARHSNSSTRHRSIRPASPPRSAQYADGTFATEGEFAPAVCTGGDEFISPAEARARAAALVKAADIAEYWAGTEFPQLSGIRVWARAKRYQLRDHGCIPTTSSRHTASNGWCISASSRKHLFETPSGRIPGLGVSSFSPADVGSLAIDSRVMAQFPTDEEVMDAVEAAGWLLEQESARTLEAHGFNPRPSWAFKDIDDPTVSRELDVFSYRRFHLDSEAQVSVAAQVLVECKQSANPYCAIGQDLPEWRRKGNPLEHTLPVHFAPLSYHPEEDVLEYGFAWDVLGFRELALLHGQSDFRATQMTRLDRDGKRWSASNSGVFSSLVYPLAKAVRAAQGGKKTSGSWSQPANRQPRERRSLTAYTLRFPIVLISCPLYVIDAGQDPPTLRKAPWVRVQRHLETSTLSGIFEFDVVTKDSFVAYLETIVEPLAKSIATLVAESPRRFTGEEWDIPDLPETIRARRYPSSA